VSHPQGKISSGSDILACYEGAECVCVCVWIKRQHSVKGDGERLREKEQTKEKYTHNK